MIDEQSAAATEACDSCGARPGIDVTYDPSGHYYVSGKMCPVVTGKEPAGCDVDGWRKPRDMRDEALAELQKELTETRGERDRYAERVVLLGVRLEAIREAVVKR